MRPDFKAFFLSLEKKFSIILLNYVLSNIFLVIGLVARI